MGHALSALSRAWAALRRHPQGRWLVLVVEVGWICACTLAIWACWDLPAAWFAYLHL